MDCKNVLCKAKGEAFYCCHCVEVDTRISDEMLQKAYQKIKELELQNAELKAMVDQGNEVMSAAINEQTKALRVLALRMRPIVEAALAFEVTQESCADLLAAVKVYRGTDKPKEEPHAVTCDMRDPATQQLGCNCREKRKSELENGGCPSMQPNQGNCPGYPCTQLQGHSGKHTAFVFGRIVAEWS